jgi:hypothetical protein
VLTCILFTAVIICDTDRRRRNALAVDTQQADRRQAVGVGDAVQDRNAKALVALFPVLALAVAQAILLPGLLAYARGDAALALIAITGGRAVAGDLARLTQTGALVADLAQTLGAPEIALAGDFHTFLGAADRCGTATDISAEAVVALTQA